MVLPPKQATLHYAHERMMIVLRMIATSSLRAVATVLLFASSVGMIMLSYQIVCATWWDIELSAVTFPSPLPFLQIYLTIYGFMLLPFGVFLHWLIARATGVYANWVWNAILLGSILACWQFPLGTISGGYIVWLLFSSETFRRMRMGRDLKDSASRDSRVEVNS